MAGHAADGLREIEIVAVLGGVGVGAVLAVDQCALEQRLGPKPLAQLADERRVFGPAFAEQVAHAVEHGARIGKATFGIDERASLGRGIQRRVGEQLVGQRLQARLARNHPFGAPLRLEGQVEVLKFLLRGGRFDGRAQFGRQLALLVDALEHGFTAFEQLAQIAQPGFQLTQLNVVEPVGGLLAVARNEGHRGTAVDQGHGGLYLCRTNLQFGGDLQLNLVQGNGGHEGIRNWSGAVYRAGLSPRRDQGHRAPTNAAHPAPLRGPWP